MKNCLIIAAGELTALPKALNAISGYSFIICADAGYRHAKRLGITPNLVVGDMDSLKTADINCEKIIAPAEKDDTDTMLAIRTAIAKGCDEIDIIGAFGGRLDHMYANLQALLFCAERCVKARLVSNENTAFALKNGTVKIPRQASAYISVFSLTEKSIGVTEKGVKYPLCNATLTNGFPLGVSNEFTAEYAEIAVEQGSLLIILSKK